MRRPKVGDKIEYYGAAYVGGKPLAGRKGTIIELYTSPTGRTMVTVDFDKGSIFSMPDTAPFYVFEGKERIRL